MNPQQQLNIIHLKKWNNSDLKRFNSTRVSCAYTEHCIQEHSGDMSPHEIKELMYGGLTFLETVAWFLAAGAAKTMQISDFCFCFCFCSSN